MPVYAAPTSYNLPAFVADLMAPSGQKVFQVIGDSINTSSDTSNTLHTFRLMLPFDWNGMFQVPYNGATNLGNGGSATSNRTVNSNVTPWGTVGSITGSSSLWPCYWNESTYSADPSGINFGTNIIQFKGQQTNIGPANAHWSHMPAPLFMNGVDVVTARGILYTISTSVSGNLTPTGYRQDFGSPITQIATGSAVVKSGSPPAFQYGEASCGAGPAASTTPFPGFRWTASAGVVETTNVNIIQMGTRYLTAKANGVLYNAPIAVGGATLGNHADTSKTTDAAIIAYFQNVGIPTHFWLHAGQNPTGSDYTNLDGGSLTSFKANVNAVIDRYEAILAGLGAAPARWCLIAQYATSSSIGVSNSFAFHDNMARAHYEIALARGARFSTLNTFRCTGGMDLLRTVNESQWHVWAAANDMVHPGRWAGQFFVAAEAREIARAVAFNQGAIAAGRQTIGLGI